MTGKKGVSTLYLLVLVLTLLVFQQDALAQFGLTDTSTGSSSGPALLKDGWSSFFNGWMVLDTLIVLMMSLLLGAVIAYHPSTRRRVSSLEHFEQPKTFLMYAMVAAVVSLIVKEQPAMAIVVFGIGGLMRFRTMVAG
jgi:hypothetical protein